MSFSMINLIFKLEILRNHYDLIPERCSYKMPLTFSRALREVHHISPFSCPGFRFISEKYNILLYIVKYKRYVPVLRSRQLAPDVGATTNST